MAKDLVFLAIDRDLRGATASVDTDDEFHTYRIEVDDTRTAGTPVRVYQDDVLILTDALNSGNAAAEPYIWFGEGTEWAWGSSEWRSFRHNAPRLEAVPALSEWGMLVTALIILSAGLLVLRRLRRGGATSGMPS